MVPSVAKSRGWAARGTDAAARPPNEISLSVAVQLWEASMKNRSRGPQEEASAAGEGSALPPTWPVWARTTVSVVILFHIMAVLTGVLGVPPSSNLEQAIAGLFTPYNEVMDLGYSYRYYSEPPPTPVVTATLHFGKGRAEETVRLPGRQVAGPRLRHQRQLALANAVFMDVQEAKHKTGDSSKSRLARAYARHLCLTRGDCRSVSIHLQLHLIPDMEEARELSRSPGAPAYDLFAESLFTTPEWIGDYPCDAF
jgi:hypothetical protein